MNYIATQSKFKTAFELALEKAGLKESEFRGNIYTEIGNILEPKIQKVLNIKNVDDVEYKKEYKKINLIGHIDGLNQKEDEVQEIKVISGDVKSALKQYEFQIRLYMHLTDLKNANIIVLNRKNNEVIENAVKDIENEFSLKFNTNFEDLGDDAKILEIKTKINHKLEELEIKKSDLETKLIKWNEKKEKEMLDKLEKFNNFVEDLKIDPFFNHKNEEEYAEKEAELNSLLNFETKIEADEFDLLNLNIENLEENEEIKNYLDLKEKQQEMIKNLKQEMKEMENGKYITKSRKINVIESVTNKIDWEKIAIELNTLSEEELQKIVEKNTKEVKIKKIIIK